MSMFIQKVHLFSHTVLNCPKSLWVNRKEVQIETIKSAISPICLGKAQGWRGWRIANRMELENFMEKYKPGAMLGLHAVGVLERSSSKFPEEIFKISKNGEIVNVFIDPVKGFPPRTLVLWVNDGVVDV